MVPRMSRLLALVWLLVGVLSILDRSYYDALELPVSCTAQEVREAFRKMTRLYHPDRNPSGRSRFQMINNAYQTLYDETKKYLYDRVGMEKMNDPNVRNEYDFSKLKGPQLKLKLFLTLRDFYAGKELDVMIQKQVACPHCRGTGADDPNDYRTCTDCGGKGKTTRRVEMGGGFYNLYTQTCPRCQGRGKMIGRICRECRSAKLISGIEDFRLKIHPGTASNSDLRYANMGDERMEGAPSDLVFELIQMPHSFFQRKGNDLHMNMSITLKQAILGFTKTVTHLDNHQVVVTRDEITQPGSTILFQEEGMPIYGGGAKGNLYITFQVTIPSFTNSQLDVLERFFQSKQ